MVPIYFAQFHNRIPRALQAAVFPQSATAVLLPFPEVVEGDFAADMRRTLARFALTAPNMFPIKFGTGEDGTESCQLTNGFTISRDGDGRYSIQDCQSGYIDHGPFDSLYEICRLITWLGI